METPHEAEQTYIEEKARLDMEYILSSQPELEDFFRRCSETLETVTNIMVIHWDNPQEMGRHIKNQIERDLLDDCIDRRREECE